MRKLPPLSKFLSLVAERQRALGIDEEAFERARNRGRGRTPEKRELLRRLRRRARQVGTEPFEAPF
jgi:hypothetical protein